MSKSQLAMIVALLFLVSLCGFSFAGSSPSPAANGVSNPPLAPDQGDAQSLDEGAGAASDQGEPAAEAASNAQAAAPAIPPGTVINSSNWMQYKNHFSDGEIGLWEGKWFWKMPPDVQITVGPTKVYPLPAPFIEASEKYGDQTRLEKLSNGRWLLKNYVAGVPFPIPDDPDKGQKILTNLNYRIQPHLIAGFPDSGTTLSVCNMDELQDIFCWHLDYDVRQLAYNWEPGVPRTEEGANQAWLGEYIAVEDPEQYRYATDLVLLYQDDLKIEDNFLFVPALRRSLRLSDAAHCAKIFTFADYTHDDVRGGWNGGIADFDAKFVKRMQLLALMQLNNDEGKFPENYLMPLGWAEPSWGNWELRDTWVIDVRPIASIGTRYCYGKRVVYIDTNTYAPLAQDLYDNSMNFHKVVVESLTPAEMPPYGMQSFAGGGIDQIWDVQNKHAAFGFTADAKGRNWTIDGAVKPQYNNIKEYQNPGAIMHQMR